MEYLDTITNINYGWLIFAILLTKQLEYFTFFARLKKGTVNIGYKIYIFHNYKHLPLSKKEKVDMEFSFYERATVFLLFLLIILVAIINHQENGAEMLTAINPYIKTFLLVIIGNSLLRILVINHSFRMRNKIVTENLQSRKNF